VSRDFEVGRNVSCEESHVSPYGANLLCPFPRYPGLAALVLPRLLPPLVPEENLWNKWLRFFMSRIPFLSSNRQCQSTDPNQWPGLLLSSSPPQLLVEGMLIPSYVGHTAYRRLGCVAQRLKRWSLTSKLSLSHARPACDG